MYNSEPAFFVCSVKGLCFAFVSVCGQDDSKNCERISMKFFGRVGMWLATTNYVVKREKFLNPMGESMHTRFTIAHRCTFDSNWGGTVNRIAATNASGPQVEQTKGIWHCWIVRKWGLSSLDRGLLSPNVSVLVISTDNIHTYVRIYHIS